MVIDVSHDVCIKDVEQKAYDNLRLENMQPTEVEMEMSKKQLRGDITMSEYVSWVLKTYGVVE